MKLLILGSRGIPAKYGGFETFAEKISINLASHAVNVTVYCPAKWWGWSTYSGVKLRLIPAPNLGAAGTLFFDLLCILDSVWRPGVIYMLGYASSMFCLIPRAVGRDVWINMDGVEWQRAKWGKFARWWLIAMEQIATYTATRLIADAQEIANYLKNRYAKLPAISVIAYGADIAADETDCTRLTSYGVKPNEYFLVVARIEPENHVLEIIRGFYQSEVALPLLVVGDCALDTKYAAAIREAAALCGHRVKLIGSCFGDDLVCLRLHCKAYLHGHSVGGTNPSLLEGMAVGNLIVCHDNLFNREVAAASALYFVTETELATVLSTILRPDFDAKSFRHEATERIRNCYTWAKITQQYLALLNDDQHQGRRL